MDVGILRRWKILQGLNEDELNNLACVVVYGCPAGGVLIYRDSDDVYGVGNNNLLNPRGLKSPVPESSPSSGGKVKIDLFSGLGLEKIVVGSSLVAGLDKNKTAHVWYYPLKKPIKDEVGLRMYEKYEYTGPKDGCRFCESRHIYESFPAGRMNLKRCSKKSVFSTYTSQSPPPSGTPVAEFVDYFGTAMMVCPKCARPCTYSYLGRYSLMYCEHCAFYPEYSPTAMCFSKAAGQVLKAKFDDVLDIACGQNFIALLEKCNHLLVFGYILNVSFKSTVCNPDQIVIKSISCGSNHVAAITSYGALYTCGSGRNGQLGFSPNTLDFTLRRVSVEGVVVKVCCGDTATICLTLDGSVYCFGSGMKLNESGGLLVNQPPTEVIGPTKLLAGEKFVDIANVPFTNTFFAQTKSKKYTWGYQSSSFPLPEVELGVTSLMEALVDLPISVYGDFSSKENGQKPSTTSQTDFTLLYGKKHLSDCVLKLADGDFPVHSTVLFLKSVYFRDNILKETDSPIRKEFDMTSYNPVACKALLRYFYQLPPDDLDCPDLVDLYLLAMSYKENDILIDSYARLKDMIDASTVKLIRSKAEAANCQDLLEECELFMRSPAFQAKLLDLLAQNPEATMSLL